MSKWTVGNPVLGAAASIAGIGAMLGAGINAGVQNIQAVGLLAAATGSRIGITGMDVGSLGKAALIGAAAGVAVSAGVFAVSVLRDWRSRRDAQQALEKTRSPSSPSM